MVVNIGIISDAIGIIGVTLVLLAYFLLQTGNASVDSLNYLASNLLGSLLITFSLIFHWNLSSFLIELVWGAISIMGMVRVFLKRRAIKTKKVAGPVITDPASPN